MQDYSKTHIWKNVPKEKWTDWHWQLQNNVTSLEQLEKIINLSAEEREGVLEATKHLKMRISPFLLCLMDPQDSSDPLRRQFVPSIYETESIDDANLFGDVNADDRYSPVNGLVHRYPSKVLIFPSNYCGAYCRYCFRRKLARDIEETLDKSNLIEIFNYIENHEEIEEVILSGGDPLVLSDENIDFILKSLSKISHVKLLRLHTRMPVTIPFRITEKLVSILSNYKPIFMVIHIDTQREISEEMKSAVKLLVDNGIPCFASCPLLRGVNDSEGELRNLWTELLIMRIKPYYLFHSDPVKGLRHFLVPIKRGLEIMKNLYDRMSGLAMPHYCFNVPDGGGHVLLNYNYVRELSEGHYLIRNFEGNTVEYFERNF